MKARLYQYLKKEDPTLISEFEKADTEEYRSELNKMIHTAMRERGLKMGLGKVIYHKNPLKK